MAGYGGKGTLVDLGWGMVAICDDDRSPEGNQKKALNYRSTLKGGSEGPEICLRSIVFGKTIYNLYFQPPTTPNQALLNRTL